MVFDIFLISILLIVPCSVNKFFEIGRAGDELANFKRVGWGWRGWNFVDVLRFLCCYENFIQLFFFGSFCGARKKMAVKYCLNLHFHVSLSDFFYLPR